MNRHNLYRYHPIFRDYNINLQILDGLTNQEITIPSEFHNKQIMLWMARNERKAKMSLSNYSGTLTTNSKRNSSQSNQLNIDCTDVYISRIGITHKFLDFDSNEYHRKFIQPMNVIPPVVVIM